MPSTWQATSSNLMVGRGPVGTAQRSWDRFSSLTRAVALAEITPPDDPLHEVITSVANDLYAEAVAAWGIVRANEHAREGCLLARHGGGVVPR